MCLFNNLSKCIHLSALLDVMVEFSLLLKKTGNISVEYIFTLAFFKAFCGPNMLLVMPFILK